MKKFATIAAVASSLAFAAAAQADLVAYWNFNDIDTGADTFAADAGSGTVDVSAFGGNVQNFGGTEENALFGDEAGGSLSLQGGADQAGNGTWIDIIVSTSGLQDVVLSYAGRGTGTGFNNNQVSYSTDGQSFTDFGDAYDSTHSSFELYEFDFGSALDDASEVTLRITFDGSTSSAGNNRIDNLQVNASVIPAPGALALLGVAGVIAGGRRRRA